MSLRSAISLSRPAAARCAAPLLTVLALALASPALAAQGAPPAPAARPADSGERCSNCHADVMSKRVLHPSLLKNDCTVCHKAQPGQPGKCKSKAGAKWALTQTEPDLCYGCHKRKDQTKSVHTAVRQGSCLSCHDPHGSDQPRQLKAPREKLCFDCHDLEPLISKAVRHAPVAEGRCLDCHDAHGSDQPNALVGAGTAFCQKCHDPKAPGGKGAAGKNYRVDLTKKVVHKPITQKNDCGVCHDLGHSGDNLKLLKKNPVDLCNGCHERQDKAKFPHTALIAGDCAVCHDPHSSDQPKLAAKPTSAATCFQCHQDDLSGRRFIHKPVEKGCDQCHIPHGGANRMLLKGGSGKTACYVCHQTPVDSGKVKHAALERYGCTGCHDPHGTGNRFLIAKRTNELCATCHEAQKDGKHVTPLVARGHTVGGNLNDPRKPDRPFSCASCHNPHGSDNPNFYYYGASAMESCDGCHGDKSGQHPELKNIVSRAKRAIQPGGESGAAGSGTGGAGGAGGSGGAGAGGAGSGGAGSGGAGSGGAGGGGSGSGSGAGAGSGSGSGSGAGGEVGGGLR